MKKLLIGLTLLASMSSFASEGVLTIPESLAGPIDQTSMNVELIQSLINEAGVLASIECEIRDGERLQDIANEISRLIKGHPGHDQFSKALFAEQRIENKSHKTLLCQR